jgi:hypothetical protein
MKTGVEVKVLFAHGLVLDKQFKNFYCRKTSNKGVCMKYLLHGLLFAVMLLFTNPAGAAEIFNGYAGTPWGTDLQTIMKAYPKGQTAPAHGGQGVIYRQDKPNKTMERRTFTFKENKLSSVSVRFSEEYVQNTGIETILTQHKKSYGEGKIDRSSAPHLITYIWEGQKTKISFAYAPKRLDMTVMLFEQK